MIKFFLLGFLLQFFIGCSSGKIFCIRKYRHIQNLGYIIASPQNTIYFFLPDTSSKKLQDSIESISLKEMLRRNGNEILSDSDFMSSIPDSNVLSQIQQLYLTTSNSSKSVCLARCYKSLDNYQNYVVEGLIIKKRKFCRYIILSMLCTQLKI